MSSKDNSGALFKNEKKREGKQDADYQGQITVDGVDYWLNAWLNTSTDGKTKYMSLKVQPKTAQKAPPARQAAPATANPLTDEIPF